MRVVALMLLGMLAGVAGCEVPVVSDMDRFDRSLPFDAQTRYDAERNRQGVLLTVYMDSRGRAFDRTATALLQRSTARVVTELEAEAEREFVQAGSGKTTISVLQRGPEQTAIWQARTELFWRSWRRR